LHHPDEGRHDDGKQYEKPPVGEGSRREEGSNHEEPHHH
jgi:hypothetical protein